MLIMGWQHTTFAQRTEKQMRNCAFLYSKPEMALKYFYAAFDTMKIAPGERIVDIGAKGANLAGIISLGYDNFDMTLEDIDSSCLTPQQVAFVMQHYATISAQQLKPGITTHVVIGTDSASTLPASTFAKVFFMNTFHELTKPRQMVADLYRITAPGGTLYLLETVTATKKMKRKDCGHIMPLDSEVIEAFDAAGFRLVKANVTDHNKRKGDQVMVKYYQFRRDE